MKASRSVVDSTVLGLLVKHDASAPGGSMVLTSGVAAHRPVPRASLPAAPNGALTSLAAARRPVGRTKDIADAIIALLRNGFITSTVPRADGGHRLVWKGI